MSISLKNNNIQAFYMQNRGAHCRMNAPVLAVKSASEASLKFQQKVTKTDLSPACEPAWALAVESAARAQR
jgi:hypothetical protein